MARPGRVLSRAWSVRRAEPGHCEGDEPTDRVIGWQAARRGEGMQAVAREFAGRTGDRQLAGACLAAKQQHWHEPLRIRTRAVPQTLSLADQD